MTSMMERESTMVIRQIDGSRPAECSGGKSIHFGVDVVDQQSQQEMSVDPGLDQTLVPGPQTVDPEDRFQALEAEFDLPAQAVQGGELGAGNVGIAQRGDQDEMLGGGQGARIDPAVLALAMGAARRLEGVGGLGRITRRRRTGAKRPRALWSSAL
jgi:hypothetical protein